MALLTSGLSLSFVIILPRTTPQLPRYPRSQFLAAPLIASFPTDIFLIPPSERVSRLCERRVLASHDYHARHTTNATFHQIVNGAFDDILLIVFFSHARYDVNLDLYREAYSPYFPNVSGKSIIQLYTRVITRSCRSFLLVQPVEKMLGLTIPTMSFWIRELFLLFLPSPPSCHIEWCLPVISQMKIYQIQNGSRWRVE
jgi:hypothetical protein